jgi:hypothetical protein
MRIHNWTQTAKGLILGPSARRTKDLAKLNRDQSRWVVGLFTGHFHPFKLVLTDDPICKRCLEEDESATHILCDCEAIAYLIFHHMGQFFIEPGDYYDAPINKGLHLIGSVGLIKVNQRGKHSRSLKVMVQGARLLWPTTHTFIHSFSCQAVSLIVAMNFFILLQIISNLIILLRIPMHYFSLLLMQKNQCIHQNFDVSW